MKAKFTQGLVLLCNRRITDLDVPNLETICSRIMKTLPTQKPGLKWLMRVIPDPSSLIGCGEGDVFA